LRAIVARSERQRAEFRFADGLVLERHPPQAALVAAPPEFGLLRASAAGVVFLAHALNRLRRNADKFACTFGQGFKALLVRPGLIVLESVALCAVAVVPDEVDRPRGGSQMLPRRPVLDAVFQRFEGGFAASYGMIRSLPQIRLRRIEAARRARQQSKPWYEDRARRP
jgi:hypothetical protein